MSEQSDDHSYTSIDQKLARLSPIPSEHNLFRVYDHLCRINVKAYEPEIIATGPYHHGKPNLQAMEEHKLHLSDNEFVEMMLLDGWFLLEFIVKYNFHNLVNEGDPLTMNQMVSHRNVVGDDDEEWEFINCTTELQEARIQLKEAKGSVSLLDIKFDDS
ncbi:unnamed protein product [Ilex paraguariensis]|uniref:Uncharacterized protein n=1 Tax=Ilex paraguariensis TaxID=185542 RepID=A0ABC8U1N9_9AQUA